MKYEQCYMPMLIQKKKRYAGLIDGNPYKKQYKGIEIIRRDALPFTQRIATKVLDMVLNSQDVKDVIKYIREECQKLLNGEIPMEEMIMSKLISSSNYKSDTQPHLALNKKMIARGKKPYDVGERVPYVIIQKIKGSKLKDFECSEEPLYALEHDMILDLYDHYLMKKVMKPLIRFMKHVIPPKGSDDEKKVPVKKQTSLLSFIDPNYMDKFLSQEEESTLLTVRKRKRKELTSDEEHDKYVEELCFGDLKHNLDINIASVSELMVRDNDGSYRLQMHRCKFCNRKSSKLICPECEKNKSVETKEFYGVEIRDLEDLYKEKLKICQDCTGQEEIHCSATMCKNFFPRVALKLKLDKLKASS